MEKWMINWLTPHQTNTLPKWIFSQTFFLQLILAAKCLVRHSNTSPNKQGRPLPSLLSDSYSFYLLVSLYLITLVVSCGSSTGLTHPTSYLLFIYKYLLFTTQNHCPLYPPPTPPRYFGPGEKNKINIIYKLFTATFSMPSLKNL